MWSPGIVYSFFFFFIIIRSPNFPYKFLYYAQASCLSKTVKIWQSTVACYIIPPCACVMQGSKRYWVTCGPFYQTSPQSPSAIKLWPFAPFDAWHSVTQQKFSNKLSSLLLSPPFDALLAIVVARWILPIWATPSTISCST